MAELKILWTTTALKQRNHIYEYWNRRNKSNRYSIKLNNEVKKWIKLLRQNPYLGRKTDFKNTRAITLGHYSILYKKTEQRIIITAFWDNRQDPAKLLKLLKEE